MLKLWQNEAIEIVKNIYERDDRSIPHASDILFIATFNDLTPKDKKLLQRPIMMDHFYNYRDDRAIQFLKDNNLIEINYIFKDEFEYKFQQEIAMLNNLPNRDVDTLPVGYIATANWEILDKHNGDVRVFFNEEKGEIGKLYPDVSAAIEAEFEELTLFADSKLYFNIDYIHSFSRERGAQFYILLAVMDLQKHLGGTIPSTAEVEASVELHSRKVASVFNFRSIDRMKTNLNSKLNKSISNPYRLTLEKGYLYFKKKVI